MLVSLHSSLHNHTLGKSSILNTLARRPAAIVSPIAGTTRFDMRIFLFDLIRDIVEVKLDLGGIPCILRDTAGIRDQHSQTLDDIEIEGMRRARYTSVLSYHKLDVLGRSIAHLIL